MTSGEFDAYAGIRAAAADEQQKASDQDPARVVVRTGEAGAADYARLRERIAQKQAELHNTIALRAGTARERRFGSDIARFFQEAHWIETVHQFPNGRPLNDQSPLYLRLWTVFLNAIRQRASRA